MLNKIKNVTNMDKKIFLIAGIIIIIIALVLVFTSNISKKQDDDTIKIGVISIMSGDFSVVGEQVRNTINLTLEDVPNKDQFQFIYEDGQCDKVMSINAMRKLIDVDKVQVIIAAGCSDTTIAIAPIVNDRKIVTIMPSTGGENIDLAGEYVFRNGNSDIESAVQPAKDFINIFNYTKVVLITDTTEAMEDIRKHFKLEFISLDGNIVLDELINSNEKDFRTIISKIKNRDVDSVFINSQTGITGAHFIKQATELNLNLPIFTNFNTATNTQTYDITGDLINGVYFYDPYYNEDSPKVIDFLDQYDKKYNGYPPLRFHSISTRDSVIMIIQAINTVGNDGEKIRDWLLTNIIDWEGYLGNVTFDHNGNSNTGYMLKRIVDGEIVKVEYVT